jgi:catechol 2,3-dioxygenase
MAEMTAELTHAGVELTVADLARSVDYYTQDIGLQVLARDEDTARLGISGRTFAVLRERPGAAPAPESSPGLSHFAPEVPARADLARFVRHYMDRHSEYRPTDHVVTHSCYVFDPDGYCVEVTSPRPREEWRWENGYPVLVADPLDIRSLLAEPGADQPFDGLPANSTLGHVQLKVTDPGVKATESFYCDLLGFRFEGRLGTGFIAVGVVPQRALLVFTNRFSPDGGTPAPDDSAHLVGVDLLLPQENEVHALAARLAAADHPYELSGGLLAVRDPSGNLLRFTAQEAAQ